MTPLARGVALAAFLTVLAHVDAVSAQPQASPKVGIAVSGVRRDYGQGSILHDTTAAFYNEIRERVLAWSRLNEWGWSAVSPRTEERIAQSIRVRRTDEEEHPPELSPGAVEAAAEEGLSYVVVFHGYEDENDLAHNEALLKMPGNDGIKVGTWSPGIPVSGTKTVSTPAGNMTIPTVKPGTPTYTPPPKPTWPIRVCLRYTLYDARTGRKIYEGFASNSNEPDGSKVGGLGIGPGTGLVGTAPPWYPTAATGNVPENVTQDGVDMARRLSLVETIDELEDMLLSEVEDTDMLGPAWHNRSRKQKRSPTIPPDSLLDTRIIHHPRYR